MQDLNTFLWAIGCYNLFGGCFLFALLQPKVATAFFRHCEIFTAPYEVGNASNLWLWWAAILNTAYGIANILAIRWDRIAKMDFLVGNIILYLLFLILTFGAIRSTSYGRGILINVPLFGFWMLWAIYVYLYNH